MAPRADHRAAGFSLLELMVALAVFALAVIALLHLSAQSARTVALLEERTLAEVVAENQAVAAGLLPAAALAVPASGRETSGGRDWQWSRQAAPAGRSGLLRIRIEVRAVGQAQRVASLDLWRAIP